MAEERGIAELGVAEHIHRFTQALEIWEHPWWRKWARDDVDAYCGFVREETDLRLGIEADYVAGREDRIARFLEAREWDYVVGSVHFVRDAAVDLEGPEWEHVWGRGDRARQDLGALLRDARRGRPLGPLRHHGPPRPRQGLGLRAARSPSATRATTTSRRSRRCSRPAWRWRCRPPGCASPSASCTRRRRCSRWRSTPGVPIALSSDAHVPDQLGFRYDDAVAALTDAGVTELCVFERRERRMEPIG